MVSPVFGVLFGAKAPLSAEYFDGRGRFWELSPINNRCPPSNLCQKGCGGRQQRREDCAGLCREEERRSNESYREARAVLLPAVRAAQRGQEEAGASPVTGRLTRQAPLLPEEGQLRALELLEEWGTQHIRYSTCTQWEAQKDILFSQSATPPFGQKMRPPGELPTLVRRVHLRMFQRTRASHGTASPVHRTHFGPVEAFYSPPEKYKGQRVALLFSNSL